MRSGFVGQCDPRLRTWIVGFFSMFAPFCRNSRRVRAVTKDRHASALRALGRGRFRAAFSPVKNRTQSGNSSRKWLGGQRNRFESGGIMKSKLRGSVIVGAMGLAGASLGCGPAHELEEDIDYEHQPAVDVNLRAPIAGLTAAQRTAFDVGQEDFEEVEEPDEGLGPIFNEAGCEVCHSRGGVGGGSTRVETRFGRTSNGVFDPLASQGGSLIQDHSIGNTGVPAGCQWIGFDSVPSNANVVAQRRTTPLFGLGLVDNTPDSTFNSIAATQPSAVRGRTNLVFRIATKQTVV